jgi:hypothetical protein
MFVPSKSFQLICEQGTILPEWSTFWGLYTKSSLLDLLANGKIGWKDLQETNTLAYYKKFVNYGC